ncbi:MULTISPECIES: hypothetical protein [unclassified Pseudovibrio]|uniref:hypothetical protein n=1 Tax=unclassified Pseudovibrio TaxID=2627060 RepID=UPI0007AE86D3|nr:MULTISPECIES: hypothetical protein [unclassified Pseudovibrio]KZL24603.1 REDY-like protein HapK [Pseudovibrio sp. Ad37]KZL24635.1 REDY-like protein HapK [Pseudovibrio sp. WM33]
MKLIVHKIRLLDQSLATRFEDWVINTDYPTCPKLPSVVGFSVQRADPGLDFDYYEVITVTSQNEFEKDMATKGFMALVEMFSEMAEVVEEIAGTRLGDGYRRE